MKPTLFVIIIIVISFLRTSAQPEGMILDKTNPIKKYEQIELKNGVVALEIHFNFTPKLGITAYSFVPIIKGIVKWENGVEETINPKKYWFEDKFIVEMMTDSQEEIKNFNNEKKWAKINIQELSIKAKYSDSSVIDYQLPQFSLFRPIQKTPQITASFDAEGSIIGHSSNNQIVLTVSVAPNNRTYQLIDLEIENKEQVSNKFQPDGIFSQQGGVIKIPLNLKFTPKTELHRLKGRIKDIRSGNEVSFTGQVVLFDNRTLQTLAVQAEPNFHIKENDQIRIMVPTVGKGKLELKIAAASSIKITSKKTGENFYSFTLSNLLKEENHKIDFFFQVDGNRLKETYTIDKIIPLVSILDIENIEDKTKCKIEFKLPTWVSKKRLKVAVGNDILIKGDNFKTEVNGDITTYTVVFGNTQSQGQGKIVEDVVKLPFYVMLDDTPISTKIQAKFVNKKVIEEIKENLETEAQKPKGQRNQENINKWVTKAKDLGIALGQSLDDGDLNNAINGMNNPNKTKAQKTAQDIVKWITAIAGVVLMVI